MARSLTSSALSGMMNSETDQAFIVLLTISHGGDNSPFRFTSDSTETTFNGETYIVYPFDIILPTNEQGKVSEAQLTIDNVDRRIIEELRSQSEAMTVQIDVVASDDIAGGNVTASFQDFRLRSVEYNPTTVSGRLTVEDFLQEPYPNTIFSPALYPGLFGKGAPGTYVPPPEGSISTVFTEYSTAIFPSPDWYGVEIGNDGHPTNPQPKTIINIRNDEPTSVDGQYFYIENEGGGKPYPHLGLAWVEAGWHADMEVLVHFINFVVPSFAHTIGPIIRYDTQTRINATGYRAHINSTGNLSLSVYKSPLDVNGTQLGSSYALAASDTDDVCIRLRAEGTAIKAKAWIGVIGDEPATSTTGWNIEVTNGELYEGWPGLMSTDGNTIMKCDEYGVAFEGNTAVIIP